MSISMPFTVPSVFKTVIEVVLFNSPFLLFEPVSICQRSLDFCLEIECKNTNFF